MTVSFPALGLILLFPLLGFLFNVFFGARIGRSAVNVAGPLAIFSAFAIATWAFVTIFTLPAGAVLHTTLWPWIEAGPFHVNIALRVDALSGVMIMIVTGVGSLIHLYSVGYMEHDEDYARYFAYMNLFVFSMLILVLASNLLLMFVGWEGVGLCSYLLIGFWYQNPEYAYNGRKAFVVNRVGDAGFILGIFTLVAAFGMHGVWTLNFTALKGHIHDISPAVATVACILLFVGATGKSAQLPLYVWLPDAMVGPTPVSSLIHAATMVTAGVYMICRLNFLFVMSPLAMELVATVGAITAFYAATMALVQPDIKRVLAYSTISQLGYMFLGVGVGAFGAGVFHLMTHAFFKGLLFLCAGSVMHSLGGEQDMRKMGGLWKKLPITWITMLSASIALAALPPFSGFFSKDLILEDAYANHHFILWLLGVGAAALTSFYIFRLMFMTFHGESRVEPDKVDHIHESPAVMAIPLLILGVLSFAGGFVGLPKGMLWGEAFSRFLAPVVGTFHPAFEPSAAMLSVVSVGLALGGLVLAYLFYIVQPGLPALLAYKAKSAYTLLFNKYYIDELYNLIVTRPLFWIATFALNRVVDQFVIEGLVNGTGITVEASGEVTRRSATGNVQQYAFVYVLGVVGIVAYYLYLVMH